jgi:signal transduction histidine kinase/HPt (histidine-containing phosphotransfer) domain-containing protein
MGDSDCRIANLSLVGHEVVLRSRYLEVKDQLRRFRRIWFDSKEVDLTTTRGHVRRVVRDPCGPGSCAMTHASLAEPAVLAGIPEGQTPANFSMGDALPERLPPFDLDAVLKHLNGDTKLVRKLLLGFRDQYSGAPMELRRSLFEQRPKKAEELAHSLKSIASILGARELSERAAALEERIRLGPASDLDGNVEALAQSLAPALSAAGLLDRRRCAMPAALGILPARDAAETPRPSILVVDDDRWTLEIMVTTFRDDYHVSLAESGETALELAMARMPDAILLDLNLPDIDGFEILKRLQQEPATHSIPVILLTSAHDIESETRGLALGAVDYVTKPMNPKSVQARVSSQIRLKRAEAELRRYEAKEHLDEMIDEIERSAAVERNREIQLQMKDAFLSHVSHELRSPLASIYNFVTLIADGLAGAITAQQGEYLKLVLVSLAHLKAMIDDLLEATRLGTGKLTIQAQTVSVEEHIRFVLEALRGLANSKSIQLASEVPAGLDGVRADPTRLRQILIALTDKALKFTPTGGSVRLAAHVFAQDPRFLVIEVSDTGCGISAHDAQAIFERLYQCQADDSSGGRGLGLGLHIARELVRRQGGEIWVTSIPGSGSRFCFTVPIASRSNLEPDSVVHDDAHLLVR